MINIHLMSDDKGYDYRRPKSPPSPINFETKFWRTPGTQLVAGARQTIGPAVGFFRAVMGKDARDGSKTPKNKVSPSRK